MSLVLRDYWTDFDRSLASLFPEVFGLTRARPRQPVVVPRLTLREDDAAYMVEAELPGLPAEDVHISLEDKILSISVEEAGSGENGQARTRWSHGFQRGFTLPANVDAERIEARMENGVLRLALPKVAAPEARRIEVKH